MKSRSAGGRQPYPDVALVGGADAPLDIDALRPLGLIRRDGAQQGGVVFTGHMADEGADWRRMENPSIQRQETHRADSAPDETAETFTFAGVSLATEAHHQGGAVGAERGAGERFDAQLVSFGLETQETLHKES